MSVLNFFLTKTLKRMNSKLHGEKYNITKKCIFSVFHIVRYQNAKKHAEPPICGSETTLPETCLLNVLECVRYQKAKKSMETPQNGNIT